MHAQKSSFSDEDVDTNLENDLEIFRKFKLHREHLKSNSPKSRLRLQGLGQSLSYYKPESTTLKASFLSLDEL